MHTVSVIMGVYNCKSVEALKKSVESIINQTYRNWEFIICNDGSTDNTLSILREIELLDSRIKVISYDKNIGLANALNECVKVSTGVYIARQDDDDVSELTRLEKQIKCFETMNNISIVGTTAVVFDENGGWGSYDVPEYPQKSDFLWNSPFIHPAVMMKKEDLLRAQYYRVAKETRRCEDYDLFMRMYSMGMLGYNLQEKLYQYRIENSNSKYRPMKYRIDEAKVRFIGYKKMKLMPQCFIYTLKPIVIGLIPQFIFKQIRKKQY